jgi:hypothetical protein
LTLFSAGCAQANSVDAEQARAGGRDAPRERAIPVDGVVSQLRVVPIAREAIELRKPLDEVADVVCTSKVMYVFEGAVAHCTASVNDEATGWTLRFRDTAGTCKLVRERGEPWQFRDS